MCIKWLPIVVNASARPPRPAGSQGGGTEGEIKAEMAQPCSKRSKHACSPVSFLSLQDAYSATNLQDSSGDCAGLSSLCEVVATKEIPEGPAAIHMPLWFSVVG